ncbi:MAG: HAD hydrolase family protein, partial [Limosilactobacillus fermentum]
SLGQELGVARTEMMAIGNAQNDESMITYAGIGVAMSNSIPSTIQLADELVADNNHDGVAEAVEKFALA